MPGLRQAGGLDSFRSDNSKPLQAKGNSMKSISINIDKVAIGLSLICTVHCLLLPVAFVLLPALAANTFGGERFHL